MTSRRRSPASWPTWSRTSSSAWTTTPLESWSRPLAGYTVERQKNSVVIRVDVPGRSHKDIDLTLNDAIIKVVAKKTATRAEVTRRFRVNRRTDMSDITATVKNGLLTVTVVRDDQPASPAGTVQVSKG